MLQNFVLIGATFSYLVYSRYRQIHIRRASGITYSPILLDQIICYCCHMCDFDTILIFVFFENMKIIFFGNLFLYIEIFINFNLFTNSNDFYSKCKKAIHIILWTITYFLIRKSFKIEIKT